MHPSTSSIHPGAYRQCTMSARVGPTSPERVLACGQARAPLLGGVDEGPPSAGPTFRCSVSCARRGSGAAATRPRIWLIAATRALTAPCRATRKARMASTVPSWTFMLGGWHIAPAAGATTPQARGGSRTVHRLESGLWPRRRQPNPPNGGVRGLNRQPDAVRHLAHRPGHRRQAVDRLAGPRRTVFRTSPP